MIDPQVFDGRGDTQHLRALVDRLVVAPELAEVDGLLADLRDQADYLLERIRESYDD